MNSKPVLIFAVCCFIALQYSGCQSATTSSNQAVQAPGKEPVLAGNRMSPSERPQPGTIKLYPKDEGSQDPSFAGFRERLLKAVEERDAAFILSILDPKIINKSDGEDGEQEFKDQWKIESQSGLWETLQTTLS